MAIKLNAVTKLLFIGDSITDCDWRKDEEKIGQGYVRMVRDLLAARDPASAPIVINRGISGNRIPDLQKRWDRDVLELSPDVLSVFIGINDVWHGLAPDRVGCDIESYISGYREILAKTRMALPHVRFVLCEPSVLWLEQFPGANDALLPYVKAVHDLAKEFAAGAVVGLHDAFERARSARPDIAWTRDGVHPTSTGHALIATKWLEAIGGGSR